MVQVNCDFEKSKMTSSIDCVKPAGTHESDHSNLLADSDNVQYLARAPADSLMASNSTTYSSVTAEPVAVLKKADFSDTTQLVGQGGRRPPKRRRRRLGDSDMVASKWRLFPLSHTGFIMSLLPRRPTYLKDSDFDKMTAHDRWTEMPAAPDDVQFARLIDSTHSEVSTSSLMTSAAAYADTCGSSDVEVVADNCSNTSGDVYDVWLEYLQQEGHDVADPDNDHTHNDKWRQYGQSMEEQTTNRPLRAKKKWRVEKARRQLKTPHCRSVSNCVHGVSLYVNHRVLKRMTMVVQPTSHRPCSVTLRRIDKEKGGKRQLTVNSKPTPRPVIQQTTSAYDETSSNSTSRLLYAVDTCSADRSVGDSCLA